MKVVEIELDKIEPNEYNPNAMKPREFNALKGNIKKNGFLLPILLRAEKEKFIIVDGEHRWRACLELKYEKIPAVILEKEGKSDIISKLLSLQMNKIRGEHDEYKEGLIYQEAIEMNINVDEISSLLGVPIYEISRVLKDLNISDDFSDIEDISPITEEIEIMSFALPVDLATELKSILKVIKDILQNKKNNFRLHYTEELSFFLDNFRLLKTKIWENDGCLFYIYIQLLIYEMFHFLIHKDKIKSIQKDISDKMKEKCFIKSLLVTIKQWRKISDMIENELKNNPEMTYNEVLVGKLLK